jgi:acetylserotonin N-methyltransferase
MKHDLLSIPSSDPSELLRRRDGIYAADLLVCAAGRLHFFDWLAGHPSRLPEICRGLALAERPADVMLALFASLGLVEREGERFRVTDLARDFLTDGSRFDLGPYFSTMSERPACGEILEVLRTGKPTSWGSKRGGDEWTKAMEDGDVARSFTAAMDGRGAYLAPPLASRLDLSGHASLLDIAGGSGVYACAIAAKHRGLKATVLEVRGLLRSSFEALPEGGMVAIHDAHLNEEKTGPLPVAEYSVLLMCSTEGKCYSVGEIRAVLEETGFTDVRLDPTVAWRSVVTATRPA